MSFALCPANQIFSEQVVVIALDSRAGLATLQSRVHEVWARFFASSMKDDLRYTPSDCFATFPFAPSLETAVALDAAGQAYHDHRAQLMIARNEGLTKTYNRFHNPHEKGPDIVKLRELHDAMDGAVLNAYGWTDLAERIASDPDSTPRHLSEETEDDHKYQGRYFWPPLIRDEVLARLLALNAERAEQDRVVGLAPATSEEGDENVGEDNESAEDVT
jgi:hypothetical protein